MTKGTIGLICLTMFLTLTVLTGGGWAEEHLGAGITEEGKNELFKDYATNNRVEQRFDSPTLVIVEPPFADLSVSVDEIIEVLEKARLYIWNELPQSTTLEFDPCTIDPICMAQRQVERMRERKALREKIDRILKVLK